MYIELSSRQSGKTTRMLQNILYQVTMIKDIKIIIISGNIAMQYHIEGQLKDLFNRSSELKEKFNKNFIFICFDDAFIDVYRQNYISLSLLLQSEKNYTVYCDEFLYAKNAHNFLLDKIENVDGFKDKLYLTASPDLNGKHKEIFDKFVELNGNEYTEIRPAYFNKIEESWKDVKFIGNV